MPPASAYHNSKSALHRCFATTPSLRKACVLRQPGTDPAVQAPPDRVVTHVAPKTGVSGATLTAYAEPDKCKLLVVGSRGLSAFRLCGEPRFVPADPVSAANGWDMW